MNASAYSPSRPPTSQEIISLLSLSRAVHVHVSPAPSTGAFIVATFFCFAAVKLQISSHWTRFDVTLRTSLSCRSAQNLPASTKSFETVLIDTSQMREIERMDDLSQSRVRIWTRVFRGSLFMPLISELLCLVSSIKVHYSSNRDSWSEFFRGSASGKAL